MKNFDEKLVLDTAFGKMETVFVAQSKGTEGDKFESVEALLNHEEPVESHYIATMLDGDYKGMKRQGRIRQNAIYELMSAVSEQHARDLIEKYEVLL